MKNLILFSGIFFIIFSVEAQTKSPSAFLGYESGDRFTPHHRVLDYFQHVAENNENVILREYGKTYENRRLIVAFVSTPENIRQLETIRMDNLKRAGLVPGDPELAIPVHWMSYNVHGNEAVSSEASMKTLYSLIHPGDGVNENWLENTLVVLDPCINPDGRSRYVHWYRQKMNRVLQPDLQSKEHQEPWPGGRGNHYLFDLNRDWAWQTQLETRQRLSLYNDWLPQVHLDFHEQEIDVPYYFAPAAEPLHEQLTDFQQEYQEAFGKNTAAYFDKNNWFYFTKERFDLLYPSYGDTYPMFNGAIGMTIEQAGSGSAGVAGRIASGDTITLKDRIIHHHTTAISSLETTSRMAEKVLSAYKAYFEKGKTNPEGQFKSFVIKNDANRQRVKALLHLLDLNGIRYGWSGSSAYTDAFSYQTGKEKRIEVSENDIVISAYQPKSVLTQILFEPEPVLNDSITYDITSWALPYAFGLEAYALTNRFEPGKVYKEEVFDLNKPEVSALAYIAPWKATLHVKFLAALLQNGIRVRFNEYPFQVEGNSYAGGSLIITRGGNEYVPDFHTLVNQLANDFGITLHTTSTGMVDTGKDLGSPHVPVISPPKIALVGGVDVSSLNFGEIWHFLDSELGYPVVVLDNEKLQSTDLRPYDVLVLPSGNYNKDLQESLNHWVEEGGKLIAIENALDLMVNSEFGTLQTYANEAEKIAFENQDTAFKEKEATVGYLERERDQISYNSTGAVFEVKMDETHPLAYGTSGLYYTLKNKSNRYALLSEGYNVGYIAGAESHRTGFIGYKVRERMINSMVFGMEAKGEGHLVYLVDNPLFRSFWENGKLIFANALFLAGN
jgi:hypothetical protein